MADISNGDSQADQSKELRDLRERLSIYSLSVGWAAGRSSIFVYLSYFGVVLGASPLEQSILTSVRNLGSNMFQSVWGWLADLKGRRLVLVIGFTTLSLSTLLLPFVTNPFELVLVSLVLTSIGFAVIPAWNAFLGDYSSEKTRASFVGKINSLGTITSVALILSVGVLMDLTPFPFPRETIQYVSSRPAFVIPFIIGGFLFVVGLGTSFFLVEKYDKRLSKVPFPDEVRLSMNELIQRNPPFRRLLPIDALFKFAMSTAWPIFPFVTLRVATSWLTVAILWIVFNLPRGIGQAWGGKLADRLGKKPVLIASRVAYTLVPVGFAIGLLTGDILFLLLANIPGGMAFGAEETAIATYSLDCSTTETRARYYSILLTFEGIAAFSGAIFAGLLMDIWLKLAGIDYSSIGFNTILFSLLIFIAILRFATAILHGLIHANPLDFELEQAVHGRVKYKS
ncbi:MAG: MFS transporter [Candidatus Heimdallarchaeota archaeon]